MQKQILPHQQNPYCLSFYENTFLVGKTFKDPQMKPIQQLNNKSAVYVNSIMRCIVQSMELIQIYTLEKPKNMPPTFQLYFMPMESDNTIFNVFILNFQNNKKEMKPEEVTQQAITGYVNLVGALAKIGKVYGKDMGNLVNGIIKFHEKVKNQETKKFKQFSQFCEKMEDCWLFVTYNHQTHMKFYSPYGWIFRFQQNQQNMYFEQQLALRMLIQRIEQNKRSKHKKDNIVLIQEKKSFIFQENEKEILKRLRDWKTKEPNQAEMESMRKLIENLSTRILSSNYSTKDFYRQNLCGYLSLFGIEASDELQQADSYWQFRQRLTIKPIKPAQLQGYDIIVGYSDKENVVEVIVLSNIQINNQTNSFQLMKKALMEVSGGLSEISIYQKKDKGRNINVLSMKGYCRYNQLCFNLCLYFMTLGMAMLFIIQREQTHTLVSDNELELQKNFLKKVQFYQRKWKDLSQDLFFDNELYNRLLGLYQK